MTSRATVTKHVEKHFEEKMVEVNTAGADRLTLALTSD